jgi:hypothetical protein
MNYILLFIFLFLVLNSIIFNKQVIISLILLAFGAYVYYFQPEKVTKTIQKIIPDNKPINIIENYKHYQPDTIESVMEHIDSFNSLVNIFNRETYEKLLMEKRFIMNKLYGMLQSMTGTDDESRFIEILKNLDKELNMKIKRNYDNNNDILLVSPDEPEPMNAFDKRDYL